MSKRQYTHKPRETQALFLSLGAGVQSSTLVEMYVEGDLSADPLDAVIFADTGDEPQWVYEQVEYLRGRLKATPTPLVTVSTGNLIEDIQHAQRFVSMPLWVWNQRTNQAAMIRRQCTKEYKIEPIRSHILDWLVAHDFARIVSRSDVNARRVRPGVLVKQMIGISLDEFLRACQSERDPAWLRNDYPLLIVGCAVRIA